VTVVISNPTIGDAYTIYFSPTQVFGPPVAILDGAFSAGIANLEVGVTYYFAAKTTRTGTDSVTGPTIPYTVTSAQTQQLRLNE
jgi:hypothetical protein